MSNHDKLREQKLFKSLNSFFEPKALIQILKQEVTSLDATELSINHAIQTDSSFALAYLDTEISPQDFKSEEFVAFAKELTSNFPIIQKIEPIGPNNREMLLRIKLD